MGQVLHKCAKTTHRTRKEIQQSKEGILQLAKKYGVNHKTILKWRNRKTVEDGKMGPIKTPAVLTPLEQKIVVDFRIKTELPLDDVLIALKDKIPALTRSNLHRCLQKHGVSRLPQKQKGKIKPQKFKDYPLGYFHMDITVIGSKEGKCYLVAAIDRVTKFVYAEIHKVQSRDNICKFLENLIIEVPYKIHTILTDNGAQFTYRIILPEQRPSNEHPFDALCRKHGIKHRHTQFNHPWTNGQIERFNRSIKEQTTNMYYYENMGELKGHIHDYLMAHNYAKKLKSIGRMTPYEKILQLWEKEPSRFIINPIHKIVGLNT